MPANSFGTLFRLTTFGESHGPAMGGVLDGCPAGLFIDEAFVQRELDRRKPGQSAITTQRKEDDRVEFLSGIADGRSLGTPIGFIIRNKDQQSADYSHLKDSYRPGHADFTYEKKYGLRDHRGGGRSSARETLCRVVGGAIAKLLLREQQISIRAWVHQIGDISVEKDMASLDLSKTEGNLLRCPDEETAEKMLTLMERVKAEGDTLGGVICCVVENVPAGLGEPVFDKLNAALGHAMLGINAVKGFETGSGFAGASLKGSEMNDVFMKENGKVITRSNHSGGIQGGISNGMPVYFRVAFKPVSTLMKDQTSINKQGETILLEGKGRHDVCVLPRAVPIVEAMAALVLADHLLLNRSSKI